ncbi:glycosyltransferase family 2 protein [Vibrio cholerae]|uniref:glycosyltransferase family 2 protein n=1 Tax=Vibrio cholerae TaxID=666 RepID=UPI003016FC0B
MNRVKDLVSIIMPAHNAKEFIATSITSVLEQTYAFFELIIVNDRSTDDTKSEIEKFSDERVVVINNESDHGGVSIARNIGIKKARGEYIAFLDSDDYWFPQKLDLQLKAMKDTGLSICHSSYYRVNHIGGKINQVPVLEHVRYKDQLLGNKIPNLTGIYNCNKLGVFEQKDIGHEDYEMWLRILRKGDSIGLDLPLACYRVLPKSVSSDKIKAAMWHYKILASLSDIGFLKRKFLFVCYIISALKKRL